MLENASVTEKVRYAGPLREGVPLLDLEVIIRELFVEECYDHRDLIKGCLGLVVEEHALLAPWRSPPLRWIGSTSRSLEIFPASVVGIY
jgi:hypothetical protein